MFAILLISFVVLTAWIATARQSDPFDPTMPYLGTYEGSELQALANVSAIDDAVADSICMKAVVGRCNAASQRAGADCDAASVTTDTYRCKVRALMA